MATRIYLPSTGAAAVSPAFNGAWTENAGADRLRCVTTKVTSAMTSKVRAHTATAANSTFLSRMYVSDPLGPQTISAGTVKGTIRVLESAVNDNLDAMVLMVRVVSNDGSTYRSPILYGPTTSTVGEFNTSLRAKRLATGGATAAVTVTSGDRLVIEIGTVTTVGGTSLSDSISYGDNAAADLGDNETDTAANNPFVEFSQTIVFTQNLTATASATVATLTEAAARVYSTAKTVSASLATLAEAVVGTPTYISPNEFGNWRSGRPYGQFRSGIDNRGFTLTIRKEPHRFLAWVRPQHLNMIASAVLDTITEAVTRTSSWVRSLAQGLALATVVTQQDTGTIDTVAGTVLDSTGINNDIETGSMVVAGISFSGAGTTVIAVTDAWANAYTIIQATHGTGGGALAWSRITHRLAAGDSVEANFDVACFAAMDVISVTNAVPSPFDQTSNASGSGTTLNSGATPTTTFADEVVVEVMAHAGSLGGTAPFAFTDGATLDGDLSSTGTAETVHVGHRIVTSTAAYTATATITGAQSWAALVATFKASPKLPITSVSASKVFPRTVTATVATLTEAVVRAAVATRAVFTDLSVPLVWGTSAWSRASYNGVGLREALVSAGGALVRAASAAIATIDETVSRGATAFGRTVAQSLTPITEAVTATKVFVRTSADSLATLTEAVARGATLFTRSMADTLGAITEAVVAVRSGVNNLVRTVADTLGSIGDSATHGITAFTRTLAESLTPVSEAVTRLVTLPRTVAQTMGAVTEAVAGIKVFQRIAADTVATLTEVTARLFTGARAVADTLGAISEALTVAGNALVRSVAQTLGATSEAVARTGSALGRSASDTVATIVTSVGRVATYGRSVAQSLGAIVESVANGAQLIGGMPPSIIAGLRVIARGLGYSPTPSGGNGTTPTPTGSGSNPKPRN